MLTLGNSVKTAFVSAVICLLIVGVAAAGKQSAAQGRSRQQTAATERRAANQARAETNKQVAQQQRTERQAAAVQQRVRRQAAAEQKQAQNRARAEARVQIAQQRTERQNAAMLQLAERKTAVTQRRVIIQTRTETNKQPAQQQPAERQVAVIQQRVGRTAAATQRRPANQTRAEAPRQVAQQQPVGRRAAGTDRRSERQVAVDQRRTVNRVGMQRDSRTAERTQPRQQATITQNRTDTRARVQRNEQTAGGRGARTVTARNDDRRHATTNARHNSSVWRNVARRGSRPGFNRVGTTGVMYPRRDAFRSRVRWRTTLNSGRRSRIFTHIVWPSYGYPVYYRHGPDLFVSYYRPSFHRKYIFFGIGDFWPFSYTYVRYYWYGWYPYNWYGCYPTAAVCQTPGDTYNYYTYNTYNYDSGTAASDTSAEYAPPLQGVDENTFADIRQKLAAEQQQQPDSATLTDKLFEQGVNDFEQGDYDSAARAFGNAVSFEPNDLILPFAYVQALFASGQYSNAADVLRQAIEQMPVDRQGLFFPRGLYSNDDIFFAQVEQLQSKAASADDADLSLLLAYQLMGQEKYDDARDWLTRAANYDVNQNTAAILIDLLNRVEEQPQNDSGNT